MKDFIVTTNLTKIYSSLSGDVLALQDISFNVSKNEFVGILGKSGAGKSTLVNMLTGVDTLTSGSILINGTDLGSLNEDQRSRWRGKNIGIVYQSFELLNQLTVLENITIAMDFSGNFTGKQSVDYAMTLLDEVEIAEHAHKKPSEISGGQRQRVAIARALANDPQLIIADEPTGSLDSKTSKVIMDLFSSLRNKGKTLIMVTHNKKNLPYFSQVLYLKDGQFIEK